ncbi:hydrogenase nickel incorporation protein HypB [Oryzomonas rubra]|uniref:Hydrogenase nickel incorporation protein HypB n=1 Tax=Oryzomonas rubra TaxID=2509454 RepID=A0A5A9X5L9_9BACT|nr:hydrogenase nickel incorporation protein HypB [Oryzomonas rubra]
MCQDCGCESGAAAVIIQMIGEITTGGHGHNHSYAHPHDHHHDHDHVHEHGPSRERKILVEEDVLLKNNLLAERNRGYLSAKKILALNLVSSPGSGKTSLLEKTINDLKNEMDFNVIEGDQQTLNDALRIEKTGVPVVQINTGNGCHLDADMIHQALLKLGVGDNGVLMIENVGNLVCPAMFDLGESKRVVIISVTEGEDKPLKYPNMFATSDVCVITKTDLLPHLDFSLEKLKDYARQVNPHLEFIEHSVKGENPAWYGWLRKLVAER